MSTIRRQSIISSAILYFGFVLGFVNTYLFARFFTEEQYGLAQGTFLAIANIMYALANLGTSQYIIKFFPYYTDNLPREKNDQFSFALVVSLCGFILVTSGGFIFKDLVIRKYGTNAPDLVTYFYWIFPLGFGLTIFSLLEAFAWQFGKAVISNFLREAGFRLLTTFLIVLTFVGVIKDFDLFIKIYAFTYIAIAATLMGYLFYHKKLHFHFSISRVTRKFFKKIITLMGFMWSGLLVFSIAQVFDTLVIAAVMADGLKYAGIYTLAQNISSLIQAPQRAVVSAAVGPLSRSWKDKDYDRIKRIYSRSSINQLIFAVGMFVLIWINFTDGVLTFKLKEGYLLAQPAFLFIGLMRVIELGAGINAQIISTSVYWRFEFISGLILLALAIPLNYLLTKQYGIQGTAASNLIAITTYNTIRYLFLYRKFKMQPFSINTLYALLLGLVGYLICHYLFNQYQGILWIFIRSAVFVIIYLTGVLMLNLSPDIKPVLETIRNRITPGNK